MYRILVCDDERDIVSALRIYLEAEGHEVVTAYTGAEALAALEAGEVHLVLLDIMMPQMDGITATVKIREISNAPILFITAKSETEDMVLGLNVGADDYITKPFVPVELLARVRSQLRRYMQLGGGEARPSVLTIGGVTLDDTSKAVTLDGEPVSLTPREYDILKLLMSHPGQVFSPKEIYHQVWGEAPYGAENAVAVHIRHLREKLEFDPAEPRYIKVLWGKGYRFENVQKRGNEK